MNIKEVDVHDMEPLNPIEFFNGDWGFWDETWNNFHGGYNSENEARNALREYAKSL